MEKKEEKRKEKKANSLLQSGADDNLGILYEMALVINGIYVFDVYVKYEVIERKQKPKQSFRGAVCSFFFYVNYCKNKKYDISKLANSIVFLCK